MEQRRHIPWSEPDNEDALSRERRALIDSFVECEITVYSNDFIRDLAAVEIQFQIRAIQRAQSTGKDDFDVIGEVCKGSYTFRNMANFHQSLVQISRVPNQSASN